MNWIEVNGTSLRYDVHGSGKSTLVLVHEMGHHFGYSDDDMEAIEEAAEARDEE